MLGVKKGMLDEDIRQWLCIRYLCLGGGDGKHYFNLREVSQQGGCDGTVIETSR